MQTQGLDDRRASTTAVPRNKSSLSATPDNRRRSSSSIKERASFFIDNDNSSPTSTPRTNTTKRKVVQQVSQEERSDNLSAARQVLRPKPRSNDSIRWCILQPPELAVVDSGSTSFAELAQKLGEVMTADSISTALIQTSDLLCCLQHVGSNAPASERARAFSSVESIEAFFKMPIPVHNSARNKEWTEQALLQIITTLSTTNRAATLQKEKLMRRVRTNRIEAWEVTFDDTDFQQTVQRIKFRSTMSETWCIFDFVEVDKRHRSIVVEQEGHQLEFLRQRLPKDECRFVLIDMVIGHALRQHRIILALWVPGSQANGKTVVPLVRQRPKIEEYCQAVKFLRLGSRQHFRRSMLESKLHLAGLMDEILLRVVVRRPPPRHKSKSSDFVLSSGSRLSAPRDLLEEQMSMDEDDDEDSSLQRNPFTRSATDGALYYGESSNQLIPWPFYADRHALFGDLRVELARRFNLVETRMSVTLVPDVLFAKPQAFSQATTLSQEKILTQKEKRLHEIGLEHGALIFLEEARDNEEEKVPDESAPAEERKRIQVDKILEFISNKEAKQAATSPPPPPPTAPLPNGLAASLSPDEAKRFRAACAEFEQAKLNPLQAGAEAVRESEETKEVERIDRQDSLSSNNSSAFPDPEVPYPSQSLPEEMHDTSLDLDDIFIVQDNIGRGRTATVHQALYQDLVMVAVKEFKFGRLTETIWNGFETEVNTLRSLRHPNIAAFIGSYVDKEAKELWLVLEWLPGGCLRDVIADESIEIEYDDVLRMALDIARGMEYLHSKGVMHRDLKSHNLLLDDEYRVKVTDFGTAKHFDQVYQAFTEVGTLGYIAPEVVEPPPEGYSKLVDVFSYGVLLWEIFTRELDNPLTNLGTFTYARKVVGGFRPPIPEDCPRDFARLISDCWASNPEDRPHFSDIVKRLNRIIGRSIRNSRVEM